MVFTPCLFPCFTTPTARIFNPNFYQSNNYPPIPVVPFVNSNCLSRKPVVCDKKKNKVVLRTNSDKMMRCSYSRQKIVNLQVLHSKYDDCN
ncbi:hypothetical protein LSTR_LSTR008637 [Laodelphax striatellus]|uniref:Uncharacterized protein n=1 Tax=Laodelphax striatellus TaxID=195883 RepID=A0A482WN12_LAOST|nr:hypothetical protein LSTR_LSTR008637 [Laodelphax striatellus]